MSTKTSTTSASMIESKPNAQQKVADRVDRHLCYELSVQDPEAEIDFIERAFGEIKGRVARSLREDFCGTGNTSCEWVSRGDGRTAIGLDIDQPTLDWGIENKVVELSDTHKENVSLINCDVLKPVPEAIGTDIVLAHNFSYWLFKQRDTLRAYFVKALESLADDGVLFFDCYGGWESHDIVEEPKDVEVPEGMEALFGGDTFEYVWDQDKINPITGEMECYIHFVFLDGSKMERAFSYSWRMWSIPELRELLAEAGFAKTTVYWEGTVEECTCGKDGDDCDCDYGEGDGDFQPTEVAETCQSWICYIAAEK